MAKRGFFAEINYQAQQAEKRKRQQEAAALRAHNAAVREQEQARKKAERARAAAARAHAAEKKAAEKKANDLYVESREAEANALNLALEATYEEIDSLLAATLEVDDYVDLENLRVTPEHPSFDPGPLADPIPLVPDLQLLAPPQYQAPIPPTGLSAAFGGKKKHEEATRIAQENFNRLTHEYHEYLEREHASHRDAVIKRDRDENDRIALLEEAQEQYQRECADRESAAHDENAALDKFINELAFDIPSAIEDYVGIVLSNSIYPDSFPVDYDYSFDISTRELTMTVHVPLPGEIPSAKGYRYVKARDEIVETKLSQKDQKERYAKAIHETAIRSIHEVFEADRAGKIKSISLTIDTERISPSTGLPEVITLAIVAAAREQFMKFELSQVQASATLEHLGAAISKNPFALTPADTSRGVRQQEKP